MATACTCRSYGFPHRLGGGRCFGKEPGTFCGACGEPAVPVRRDFGFGAYECHGSTGVHRDIRTVSECCEAELFDDASLKSEYH